MPPHRRDHRAVMPPPYNGWLQSRHGRGHRRRRGTSRRAQGLPVPGDVLSVILSRASSSFADVVRYGATCRHWGHAVATYAGAISRALPPPAQFFPHLALGFFHQDANPARGSPARPPRFVPTEAASRLLGLGSHLQLPAGQFEHARPVASRNGRVVLELRRDARAHGALRLCVCNPMTGDVSMLPPLSGNDCPGIYYGCAILTGDDLDVPPPSSDFFRVLLVYIRGGFTALRSCSSSSLTAGPFWGPEERKPGVKMSAHMQGHAVVVGGTAYWPMRREAFGVRLDGAPSEPMDVLSVPYRSEHPSYGQHVLGTSPDGKRLSFVSASFMSWTAPWKVCVNIETQLTTAAGGLEWEGHRRALRIQLPDFVGVNSTAAIRLRWFGERSGTVLFTVDDGQGSRNKGAFMLNIATGSVEKLAGGAECHARKYLCGYEMDRAALLASVARVD